MIYDDDETKPFHFEIRPSDFEADEANSPLATEADNLKHSKETS